MTSPVPSKQSFIQRGPRRVHFVLRDGEILLGSLFLNEGQALAPYLSSRKSGWVNVVDVKRLGEEEMYHHMALQSDHILRASSLDGDLPVVVSVSNATVREVDITLDDATHVRGGLQLSDRQRLVDYLHACGKFLPVLNATRVPSGENLGDCALNCLAIRVVHDARLFGPGVLEAAGDEEHEARSLAGAPVNAEVAPRASGPIRVITERRIPDRRTGPSVTSRTGAPPLVLWEPGAAEAADAQPEPDDPLTHHWLVRLAADRHLLPPDAEELPASPSLAEIWGALARRNGVSDAEIAGHVAAAFGLQVAALDEISPAALASMPEKVARKLGVIPLTTDRLSLAIAVSDPSSVEIEQQLGFATRRKLQFRVAAPSDIHDALDRHYKRSPPG